MKLLDTILENALSNLTSVAVAEKEASYSYQDLLDAMDSFASDLTGLEVNKRPVLIFGKNDFLSLAAMLASNLTGRAYIPVDSHTPIERTEMILGAAKPSAIMLTTELDESYQSLFAANPQVVAVNFDRRADFDGRTIDTRAAVSGKDTTYIIYTSGTTGVPKGVAVSHDNLATFTNWMNTAFVKFDKNQFLEQPLYSFDLSIFSIYPSLTTAGTLVSLSREETTNFKLLFERLNSTIINTWISTPSFVDICLLDPSFTQDEHPELRQFIFCGEELTHKTAEKLLKAFPNATVYNTYGPTEATGAISSIEVTPELLNHYDRVPIGRAKPGVTLEILDREIIITGDSVATGYFENSEKTAEAFFIRDGKPAYHTGDAGFFDSDGVLNYNGRIDFQVKFNGFRIELQDIEANLTSLPTVEKALVVPQENAEHKVTALVAVLVAPHDSTLSDRDFTKQLKESLAPLIMDYMMPTKFVYVADFPLNQNGKIDRKAVSETIFNPKGGQA